MKDLGFRLYAARKKTDISARAVARMLKVSHNTVLNHEGGRNELSASQLKRYAEIYETTPNELLAFEDTYKQAFEKLSEQLETIMYDKSKSKEFKAGAMEALKQLMIIKEELK